MPCVRAEVDRLRANQVKLSFGFSISYHAPLRSRSGSIGEVFSVKAEGRFANSIVMWSLFTIDNKKPLVISLGGVCNVASFGAKQRIADTIEEFAGLPINNH